MPTKFVQQENAVDINKSQDEDKTRYRIGALADIRYSSRLVK